MPVDLIQTSSNGFSQTLIAFSWVYSIVIAVCGPADHGGIKLIFILVLRYIEGHAHQLKRHAAKQTKNKAPKTCARFFSSFVGERERYGHMEKCMTNMDKQIWLSMNLFKQETLREPVYIVKCK